MFTNIPHNCCTFAIEKSRSFMHAQEKYNEDWTVRHKKTNKTLYTSFVDECSWAFSFLFSKCASFCQVIIFIIHSLFLCSFRQLTNLFYFPSLIIFCCCFFVLFVFPSNIQWHITSLSGRDQSLLLFVYANSKNSWKAKQTLDRKAEGER